MAVIKYILRVIHCARLSAVISKWLLASLSPGSIRIDNKQQWMTKSASGIYWFQLFPQHTFLLMYDTWLRFRMCVCEQLEWHILLFTSQTSVAQWYLLHLLLASLPLLPHYEYIIHHTFKCTSAPRLSMSLCIPLLASCQLCATPQQLKFFV